MSTDRVGLFNGRCACAWQSVFENLKSNTFEKNCRLYSFKHFLLNHGIQENHHNRCARNAAAKDSG